jgi:hypothetical protein
MQPVLGIGCICHRHGIVKRMSLALFADLKAGKIVLK